MHNNTSSYVGHKRALNKAMQNAYLRQQTLWTTNTASQTVLYYYGTTGLLRGIGANC
jgi:hypothetical protein